MNGPMPTMLEMLSAIDCGKPSPRTSWASVPAAFSVDGRSGMGLFKTRVHAEGTLKDVDEERDRKFGAIAEI